MKRRGNKIFSLLADLLHPPDDVILERICLVDNILDRLNPAAKKHLDRFREFCLTHPPGCLKEIHAGTFTDASGCCPYVGHHLFRTDRSRSMFAAKLKEERILPGPAPAELPDHIAVMLKSLASRESVEEAREIISCCLLPAIRNMILRTDGGNPYQAVLQTVLVTLETENRASCRSQNGDRYVLVGNRC